MAGLLSLGPTAAVSHEAAARLHCFDRCLPDTVEFSMPRRSRGVRTPFTVHTSAAFGALDRVTINGLRCTSATRTIIDLARARIPNVRLEAAIDSAVRSGATAPVVLATRLGELRGPGRWGAPRLDDLLLDSGGHTQLERRFLQLMRKAGLPKPRGAGRPPARRPDVRPGGLPLRGARRRCRGVRAQRSRLRCRTRIGRAASQRAAGHRPKGLRVHLSPGDP